MKVKIEPFVLGIIRGIALGLLLVIAYICNVLNRNVHVARSFLDNIKIVYFFKDFDIVNKIGQIYSVAALYMYPPIGL